MKKEKKLKLVKDEPKEHVHFNYSPSKSVIVEKAQLMFFLHEKPFKTKDVFKNFIKFNQDF